MSELPSQEIRSPQEKQARIRGIYDLLPSRQVRMGRLNTSSNQPQDVESMTKDIASILWDMKQPKEGGLEGRLIPEVTDLINGTGTNTTAFLKTEVIEEFKLGFSFGIKPGDTTLILPLLGLAPEDSLPEGVFSEDPTVRMMIERKIYKARLKILAAIRAEARSALNDPLKKPMVPHYISQGQELEERLRTVPEEFSTIFNGTSIDS